MSWLQRWLLRWGLGEKEARVLLSELEESHGERMAAQGKATADRWMRGEIWRVALLPRLEEVGVDWGVLLFAVVAGVGTGVLFGLVPALSLRGESIRSLQTAAGRGTTRGGEAFQRGLLAVEVALTLVLLVSGGLLARSLLKLSAVAPGFDGTSVATVRVHMFESEADGESGRVLARILDRVRAIPGVESAGATDGLPFPGRATGSTVRIQRPGDEKETELLSREHRVTPGYLETLGIRVVMGRSFLDADARKGAPPVMIVNELLARRLWPGSAPLGERVGLGSTDYEVVGVAADIRERHLAEAPKPMAYVVGGDHKAAMSIVARGPGDSRGLVAELRRAVWSVDPKLSLSQASTLPALVRSSTGAERYRATLVLVIGVLATLLASIGVFGVTAHSVSKRAREMGIRMAMGAEASALVRAVVSETLTPGLLGIGVGLVGALFVSRLIAGYLFGVEAWDLPTYGVVVLCLLALSVLAAAVPAARAGRVDPVRVLRTE